MNKIEDRKITVGVIGLDRGWGLCNSICACKEAQIVAVCDLYEDRVERAVKTVEEKTGFSPKGTLDYKELLADESIDAIVVATSWHTHTQITIDSMRAGKFTACEVYGAYDLEDCWQLVHAYEETKTPIMFLENCCFDRFELLSTALVRAGKLGRVVYCHGAYGHELREEVLGGDVERHYRLEEYRHRNCENYPTHELGPIAKILNINRGNKFLTVSAAATKPGVSLQEFVREGKSKYPHDVTEEFNQSDIVLTTIKCANGEVITLRLDTTLPRFYDREFTVRGTKGLTMGTLNSVAFDGNENFHLWQPGEFATKAINNAKEYKEWLPEMWQTITDEEMELGHGGMDFFEFKAFFKAILNNEEMPIDVYDMASWMSITVLSEQSIAMGGAAQPVPDFTRGAWIRREPKDVVELPNPEKK